MDRRDPRDPPAGRRLGRRARRAAPLPGRPRAPGAPVTSTERWLIALDVDGTVLQEDGTLTDATVAAVQAARDAGHEVMLSTGRSASMTLPVMERL
ncbi:HAD hydrolase family protein, partial [Pseudolysinimonas sp.]